MGLMTFLTTSYWHNNVVRYGFHFVELDFNSFRKWLVTPLGFMLLLHQWTCLARQVNIIVHGVQSLI